MSCACVGVGSGTTTRASVPGVVLKGGTSTTAFGSSRAVSSTPTPSGVGRNEHLWDAGAIRTPAVIFGVSSGVVTVVRGARCWVLKEQTGPAPLERLGGCGAVCCFGRGPAPQSYRIPVRCFGGVVASVAWVWVLGVGLGSLVV